MTDTRPTPPDTLADAALLEFHRVCDLLEADGRLSAADGPLITVYAETSAIYSDVMRHVRQHGAVVKWPNGTVGPSPFYKTSRECATQLRGMLADLGLNPLTRTKVKMPDKEPAADDDF